MAAKGSNVQHSSRDLAFCAHTILQDDVLLVPEAMIDERFFDNPLVTSTMIELRLMSTQTGFDVAQALAISELGKGHAQKLIEMQNLSVG